MAQDKSLTARPDQPLAGTAITEMTQREQWNKKNPPTEATIVKDLRTTELVAREYRGTKARFYRLSGAIRLQPHLSELPPGHASVKHRHTTEDHSRNHRTRDGDQRRHGKPTLARP